MRVKGENGSVCVCVRVGVYMCDSVFICTPQRVETTTINLLDNKSTESVTTLFFSHQSLHLKRHHLPGKLGKSFDGGQERRGGVLLNIHRARAERPAPSP